MMDDKQQAQDERRMFWEDVKDIFEQRRDAIGKGWVRKDGKLSQKGSDAFYNIVAGAAYGAKRERDPLIFLMMARGPEELYRYLEMN